MLSDYIDAYIKAKQNDDKKTMERIEKELAIIGMDKVTLNSNFIGGRKNESIFCRSRNIVTKRQCRI